MQINQLLSFLLFSILLSACQSSQYLSKKEAKTIDEHLRKHALSDHFQGLVVYDPEAEKVVYNHQGDKLFTPASNVKILTLRAALEHLPDSLPLYEQLNDGRSVYLKGTGNPALFHPEFYTYYQVASLQLMLRGFDSVFIYNPEVAPERFGAGWAWDDYSHYYQPEKSAFPIYGNSLFVEWDSVRREIKLEPEYLAQFSRIRLGGGEGMELDRGEFINDFKVNVGAQTRHETKRSIPFTVEPYLISRLWEDKMDRVFKHRYEAPRGRWEPKGFIRMDTMLRKMMWESDNFLAEQILLMVGREISDTMQTVAAIRALKADSANIRWVDGSGLSRYNLLTPNYIISELEQIFTTQGIVGVRQYFPANGKSGTLKKRYTEKLNPGSIYAKTGTLSNHYNISGYIKSSSGKWYLFSFMHNHFLGSSADLQSDIEEVLYQIQKTL